MTPLDISFSRLADIADDAAQRATAQAKRAKIETAALLISIRENAPVKKRKIMKSHKPRRAVWSSKLARSRSTRKLARKASA